MKQHIFIINEKNLASSYGVGTYINEYIKCLRRFDLEIHLVTLFCDEELYNLYENEFVDYINIPTTILKNTKYYLTIFIIRPFQIVRKRTIKHS